VLQQDFALQNGALGPVMIPAFAEIHLTLGALPQQIKFNARINNGL
jgi:hypothetical protein